MVSKWWSQDSNPSSLALRGRPLEGNEELEILVNCTIVLYKDKAKSPVSGARTLNYFSNSGDQFVQSHLYVSHSVILQPRVCLWKSGKDHKYKFKLWNRDLRHFFSLPGKSMNWQLDDKEISLNLIIALWLHTKMSIIFRDT